MRILKLNSSLVVDADKPGVFPIADLNQICDAYGINLDEIETAISDAAKNDHNTLHFSDFSFRDGPTHRYMFTENVTL